MNNGINYLKGFVAVIGTATTWFFGAWDTALIVLVCLIALDYSTGLLKAFMSNEVSSDIGRRGIAKKALIFIVLIVAVLLDRLIHNEWVFRTLACYFYIANEGISILENCARMGLPVPNKLKDALIQLKGNKEEDKHQ